MSQNSPTEESRKARYIIDPVSLREVVSNEAAVESRIEELENIGEPGDAERISWLRMLGRLQEAEELGWITLVKSGGVTDNRQIVTPLPFQAVAGALRLAHVLHWQKRYSQADRLFTAALESAQSEIDNSEMNPVAARSLAAFAWQHLGKLHFDQGQFADALQSFESALVLRQELKSPEDQLASTRQAICTAEACLAQKVKPL
ncbi:tetratricopeptide repeat protein [Glutamicibacter arilaitensis]|jgi:tetratricopeptide (TPR) repeat protein|uniref:Tetratricopeptide repeat-containing protein n=3 Tax=Glutamicibacter arilaitensis TaxID=256701 RepID=A0A2N7RYD3_9MICC|nr:tetratricopeptide repeat protein [Glutamicibacter arilaitensis]PMQ18878.1 tetratricopeptide repeat-containing protein [Glutamicibacter arilaitensis]CBT77128.1 tetratrico peptide repeat-containing protein [Glutamicibacter arilaitensis Re117]